MAGQNKNAPGDHIGNKSCRENKLFMNDRCKSKCGVKTDVGMNICCNTKCCENQNILPNKNENKQYFKEDADLEDVYDQISDTDEKSELKLNNTTIMTQANQMNLITKILYNMYIKSFNINIRRIQNIHV